MADTVSKSWFVVFNNPAEHGYEGTSEEVCMRLREEWISDSPSRSGAWAYCVSAAGLHHVHMVLEDSKAMRFSLIKKTYAAGAHFEPTKGNKNEAEMYIKKLGKYKEKGEQILYYTDYGEIKGCQGQRKALEEIEKLLEEGQTPNQIMAQSFSYRRYSTMIKEAFYDKRRRETDFMREVNVTWHVGESGSGKSYTAYKLVEEHGEDDVYMLTDYDGGGFDRYNGERVLFMDEFRGQIPYSTLLNILDCYKIQIHSRYANALSLWTEVHITSVMPPNMVYKKMVTENQDVDTIQQLFRRINTIMYHYKDKDEYKSYALPMEKYTTLEELRQKATGKEFFELEGEQTELPFLP